MSNTTPPLHARRRRIPLAIRIVVLALIVLVGAQVLAQDEEPTNVLDRASQATVFLLQTYDQGGVQTISCVGSGTIVDSGGLILTNAHLVEPVGPCRGERIIVALPVREGEPPVPTYLAEPSFVDQRLDLAVLRIRGGLDGSQLEEGALNLPFVAIGDPSVLLPGNTLSFAGYPDTGTSSISTRDGQITGITTETSGSRFAWFRTDVELPGGMSGGGAYDGNGRLVGVPTSAPATTGEIPGPMCLGIQDNNRDGLITERDSCVPVGGSITAIRPISFAIPLIEAARNEFELEHQPGVVAAPTAGTPSITRLFFSTQVDDNGKPTRISNDVPSGTTSLFLFFDYLNLRAGTPYEIRVIRDGTNVPLFSLGPIAWGGGQSGTWYVGTENVTWPDGNYEFTILLNGDITATAAISVGGGPTEPVFSDLTIGIPDSTQESGFAATSALLPAQVAQIDAQFNFENMPEGLDWTEVWYLDGVEIFRETRIWDLGAAGTHRVSAVNVEGLPLGRYRLDLLLGENLAATGDVVLAGAPGPQSRSLIFTAARLADDITREGQPAGQVVQSGAVLPLGVTDLYAFVNWDLMPNNLLWTYRWFLDGRLVASSTQRWNAGGVGQDFWIHLHADAPLPEGLYAVEVLVENSPMFSANVAIGSGTRPISGEEDSNEVTIGGHVVDALTGEGIPGAMVAVLDVRFESPQFEWDESQIHTQAITDREGRFELSRGLARSNFYTFFAFAEGYITVVEDTFWILQVYPEHLDITIEMIQP